MENELQYAETPREYTLQLLQRITYNFSEEREVGRGGFGIVYKGVLDDGKEIAVKKLHQMLFLGNKKFQTELDNLKMAQHENIVRLLGYCNHTGKILVEHDGKLVYAEVEERALCLEYLEAGSLDKHLSDESCELDWHTCYKIIKGVCEGLNYLHNGCKHPIYHLDLKPANIFLDKFMRPKIGDFGLSKLFDSNDTYVTHSHPQGTLGYMPNEYIDNRQISPKFDVFSLGVIIIEIMAGKTGYSESAAISRRKFVNLVHKNWTKRLQARMSSRTSQRIRTCIEIALRCVDTDREKRPTATKIVDELNKMDTANYSSTSGTNL
ncbi:cysteine-rich receptor-like protein kinase 26 [Lolium rigidum]|uniref:cysteine-rich receptor-like protein kinase 26 n=1 Tax=Lolium rigidum TaxID=89674 RepID=UPI001F5CB6B3|nr:cysteine-rich receptor-like protein kinase 26 [Lolium rigidum]